MRFQRIDLRKYGKFTERSLEFPAAKHDFHLLIGPNEAGKSTLRAAIVDLLFGIPTRSAHGFIHPLNELRLGALISHAEHSLDFQRLKANKNTLRGADDSWLPDNALQPFLGAADKNFFDQMFGLDHNRLVSGANSILNAENDVGQILFQSAAGIASLGKIREQLLAEADKLWAPRKSGERAYYLAAEQLDKASSDLKASTVNTKKWVEAQQQVNTLQARLNTAREQHQHWQTQRHKMERLRRLAPFLSTLRETETQLAALGPCVELPEQAAATLATAERDLAVAEQGLQLRQAEVATTEQALAQISLDSRLLAQAADITRLADLRLQYSAYAQDIGHRELEIHALWNSVCDLCSQLDWPSDTAQAIRQRLPTLLSQRELRHLIREDGRITQALRSAAQTQAQKQAEINDLTQQLAALVSTPIPPALRLALAKAKALGTLDTTLQQQQALTKAQTQLAQLWPELGQWSKSLPALRALSLPSPESITRLMQERQALQAEHKSELLRLKNQQAELCRCVLEVSQFTERHHPTTSADLQQARQARNALWHSLKTNSSPSPADWQTLETSIYQADSVADQLSADVEKATELMRLNQQLEREKSQLTQISQQCSQLTNQLEQLDLHWAQQAAALNLPGMPLTELATWSSKRDKLLTAANLVETAQEALHTSQQLLEETTHLLALALSETGQVLDAKPKLSTLIAQADRLLKTSEASEVRQETLTAQLQAAQQLAKGLQHATASAEAEKNHWSSAWLTALQQAGLPVNSTVAQVETTLEITTQMAEKLSKMRQIQLERIDTMNADLAAFNTSAQQLADSIAPELSQQTAAQIAQELDKRLQQQQALVQEQARLQAMLNQAEQQVKLAQATIHTAHASVKPLLERAAVADMRQLAPAIAKADSYRHLTKRRQEATQQLLTQGDGYSRQHSEAEIAQTDMDALTANLQQIDDSLSVSVTEQTDMASQLADAKRSLSNIGGSAAAAHAEAQRQAALAKMAEVTERYIKVLTAERLLRWAIDRYRAEKQGPLLERAGAIFSTLTAGSFRKLVVDFARENLVLEGLRADGQRVSLSGLSDGSRDQLYLALRLAALELHLAQALPLPFIADDLFINYDDDRSQAGFQALKDLSTQTQVIFLSHHAHLISSVQAVFGKQVNVVYL
jgi:uncharacterized protein YhaN